MLIQLLDILVGYYAILTLANIAKCSSLIAPTQALIQRQDWLSPKVRVILVSLLTSVLPIPGRVQMGAPVMLSVFGNNHPDKEDIGEINYWSSHLYYLFSPLEKSIIITASIAGMSYPDLIVVLLPLTICMVGFGIGRVRTMNISDTSYAISGYYTTYQGLRPIILFACIITVILLTGSLIVGVLPVVISLVINDLVLKKYRIDEVLPHMDKIWFMGFVVLLGMHVKTYVPEIVVYLQAADYLKGYSYIAIPIIAVLAGLLTGSSSKMVSIGTVAAVALFGMDGDLSTQEVMIIGGTYSLEYAGYLVSPLHKCTHMTSDLFRCNKVKVFKRISKMSIIAAGVGCCYFIGSMFV